MQPSWPFILYLVTTQSNVTKALMEVSFLWNSQVGMWDKMRDSENLISGFLYILHRCQKQES